MNMYAFSLEYIPCDCSRHGKLVPRCRRRADGWPLLPRRQPFLPSVDGIKMVISTPSRRSIRGHRRGRVSDRCQLPATGAKSIKSAEASGQRPLRCTQFAFPTARLFSMVASPSLADGTARRPSGRQKSTRHRRTRGRALPTCPFGGRAVVRRRLAVSSSPLADTTGTAISTRSRCTTRRPIRGARWRQR